jgi:hypothetical protein
VTDQNGIPKRPRETTRGIVWFPRMLDKIRLQAAGELSEDYVPYLGKGFDGRWLKFLRVPYEDLSDRTLSGGTDEEILTWCFETGRQLSDEDVEVWNGFLTKRGWRDGEAVQLGFEENKRAAGLESREDIVTYFDYNDVDEGRC